MFIKLYYIKQMKKELDNIFKNKNNDDKNENNNDKNNVEKKKLKNKNKHITEDFIKFELPWII